MVVSGENKADFAQTDNCPIAPGMLAPRTRCEIYVTFTPTVTGTLSAAVNVADNASASPQTVSLKGVSTAPWLGSFPQILIVDDAPGSPQSTELSGTATPPQNIPK